MHTASTLAKQPSVLSRHWYLFAAVVVAQVSDVATLLIGVTRVGIHAEQNPLVRHLYETIGPAGPIALKVLTLAAIVPMLWWIGWHHPGQRIVPAALIAVAIGAFGVWANISHAILV